MMQRWLIAVAILACSMSATSTPAPDANPRAPFMIVQLQSADKLLDDAKYLAGKFGTPEAGDNFKALILDQLGADSIEEMGIDGKRPTGLYAVCVEETIEPAIVIMLPITDEDNLRSYVGKLEGKVEKLEANFYSLTMPEHPLPAFVRIANGYAYVTTSSKSALAPEMMVAPGRAFASGETALASINIWPDQIPTPLRKVVLAQISDTVKNVYGELDADDEYPELTEVQVNSTIRWCEMLCEGGREVKLLAKYDRCSGELEFETSILPIPGSKLADHTSTITAGSSLFTKMLGDRGAFNYSGNWAMDTDEAKKLGEIVAATGAETIMEWLSIDDGDEGSRAEVMTFCKSLVPTAEAGQIDVAISLRGADARYVWLGATRLKDGQNVDAAFRKLIAAIPESKRVKVTLDALTINNVKLHEVEIVDDDPETEKLFGKAAKLWVAVNDNALVFAYGKDAGKDIADVLGEASLAPTSNIQVDVSVKKLKNYLASLWEDDEIDVADYFGKDADRVRILTGSITGGKALQIRTSISLQLFVGLILLAEAEEETKAIPTMPADQGVWSWPVRASDESRVRGGRLNARRD